MKKTVLVLFGGKSGEHDISLLSAASVLANIDPEKYNVVKVGITKTGEWFKTDSPPARIADGGWETLSKERAVLSPDSSHHGIIILKNGAAEIIKIDAVFPVMHGTYCEDGCIQGLFEMSGIPYAGASVLSSALCMDKGYAKLVIARAGIPQARWLVINKNEIGEAAEKIEEYFTYPVFVKPCNAGSSLGAGKASRREELIHALHNAAFYDTRILVEEFIEAREIECAVLGNESPRASVLGEIIPSNEFYDYDAKYIDNASTLLVPAPLPDSVSDKIRVYAVAAYKALGCRGFSRVDFFIYKGTEKIYLNEVNTIPGFTDISMFPKLWNASGIPYSELIDRIIELACGADRR